MTLPNEPLKVGVGCVRRAKELHPRQQGAPVGGGKSDIDDAIGVACKCARQPIQFDPSMDIKHEATLEIFNPLRFQTPPKLEPMLEFNVPTEIPMLRPTC